MTTKPVKKHIKKLKFCKETYIDMYTNSNPKKYENFIPTHINMQNIFIYLLFLLFNNISIN